MDVGLGGIDFEIRSIERGSWWASRTGIRLFTCSAEDLIVHKAFASRRQDWADVERTIEIQGRKLDVPLILRELAPLAELKEDNGIGSKLEWMLRKAGLLWSGLGRKFIDSGGMLARHDGGDEDKITGALAKGVSFPA